MLNKITKNPILIIVFLLSMLSTISIFYSYTNNIILAYGDAESHINIAKRVIDGLTPGAAQLGGIWLPLPHLLMVPFVANDFLWKTGLAGSIVSAIAFIVGGVYVYKTTFLVTSKKFAGIISTLVYALNPNMLYMQSTPMTEVLLICFFIISIYYFIKFLIDQNDVQSLIFTALFTFLATLTRYDGWFLALTQAGILFLTNLTKVFNRNTRSVLEGRVLTFSTLAFFGIAIWLLWDFLILGDPLYFSNSVFSAKSQQQGWLARGELPTYHSLPLSLSYYSYAAYLNIGQIISALSLIGLVVYLLFTLIKKQKLIFLPLILTTPFIFYVATLYMGQSIIFVPQLIPKTFTWNLFNVRYGLSMLPFAAFFVGYLVSKLKFPVVQAIVVAFVAVQVYISFSPETYEPPISLLDGLYGLSHSKTPDAQNWIAQNYDDGLVLMDDYSRTISIAKSGIPLKNVIYIGNKPYWEESLENPEKYAKWIVMQESDMVWKSLYENQAMQERVFKYFEKAYTSPEILIFKRNDLSG